MPDLRGPTVYFFGRLLYDTTKTTYTGGHHCVEISLQAVSCRQIYAYLLEVQQDV